MTEGALVLEGGSLRCLFTAGSPGRADRGKYTIILCKRCIGRNYGRDELHQRPEGQNAGKLTRRICTTSGTWG